MSRLQKRIEANLVGRGSPERSIVFTKKSTVMTPPDLARPIDAPSRGSERCSTVWFWHETWRRGLGVEQLSEAALNTHGSARVLA